MYEFPVRFKGENVLKYIFPSKQKAAQKVIELAGKDARINKIIIFGSATTLKCGAGSDLDIAIDALTDNEDVFVEIARPFFAEVPSEVDIIHLNSIRNDFLLNNIQKGICIYDKQQRLPYFS